MIPTKLSLFNINLITSSFWREMPWIKNSIPAEKLVSLRLLMKVSASWRMLLSGEKIACRTSYTYGCAIIFIFDGYFDFLFVYFFVFILKEFAEKKNLYANKIKFRKQIIFNL